MCRRPKKGRHKRVGIRVQNSKLWPERRAEPLKEGRNFIHTKDLKSETEESGHVAKVPLEQQGSAGLPLGPEAQAHLRDL